jgi:hypothetical protein
MLTIRGAVSGLSVSSRLIAETSGELGPPHEISGLELIYHCCHASLLLAAGLAKSLAKSPEPARDLLEAVERRHIRL